MSLYESVCFSVDSFSGEAVLLLRQIYCVFASIGKGGLDLLSLLPPSLPPSLTVTKFKPPEDFLSLLSSQVYGPTTQLLTRDVSSTKIRIIRVLK